MKNVTLFAVLFMISTGCALEKSSSVDQSRIFTTYSAKAVGSTITAEAAFNFGNNLGTGLELDGDSFVSFNDEKMVSKHEPILNILTYHSTRTISASEQTTRDHTFVYRGNSGQVHTNRFRFPGTIQATYSTASVSMTSSFKLNWTSDSTADETVVVHYQARSGDKSTTGSEYPSKSSDRRSGELVWDQKKLKEFGKGSVKFEVCRSESKSAKEAPNAGGYVTVKTCAPEATLTITD